jgi:hypothetical protein
MKRRLPAALSVVKFSGTTGAKMRDVSVGQGVDLTAASSVDRVELSREDYRKWGGNRIRRGFVGEEARHDVVLEEGGVRIGGEVGKREMVELHRNGIA